MCSVEDGDEIGMMIEKEVSFGTGSNCRKCSENEAEVILRGKDPYCRTCFVVYATHKFRASLGKSKLVHKGDKVLVGFSGNGASLALMHLIMVGFGEESHKRLVFQPLIVYIDEGAAYNTDCENRYNSLKEIKLYLKKSNFSGYVANLESIFHLDSSKLYYELDSEVPITSDSQLSLLFSKVKSLSSKEELLVRLRNNFLLKIASDLGCSKILTAESLACTASKLLSNISLGRGAQLPFDIGFCDSREKDIKILRPMQEFGKEEIEFYCQIFNLKPVEIPSFESNEKYGTSIQMLTRKFVDELQENFPSTISTVYRTGAKLAVENEAVKSIEKCELCKGVLDTNVGASSSLQATIYSSILSKSGPSLYFKEGKTEQNVNGTSDSCDQKVGGCSCDASTKRSCLSKDEAVYFLCYGCRLIVNDVESIEFLPKEVLKSISENVTLKQMKNEIQDFLL